LQLDSYTLLVASCGLLILLGFAFVFVWLRDRRSTWLLWWGAPIIFTGAGLIFYLNSAWQEDFVAIAFGNAARIFAVGCLWYGIRLFEGRRLPWGAITAVAGMWVALCFYPPFLENLTARIVVVSLIICGLCALCANELMGEREYDLRSRFPTMMVFASGAILMFVRALIAGIAPFPVGSSTLDPVWLALFSTLAVGHILFAAIFFLTMTMERREAEQRNFALSDPLTGLLNRRAFGDFAQRMARRRAGLRDPMALLVLDLDHFKQVNDKHGHEVGDRMLKAFADSAEDSVRPTDQLFRMGGEEFCFVLPSTSIDDAILIAERIRRRFETVGVETPAGVAGTTVSIGIAATSFAVDVDVLLAAADAAVYEAKARGRNRVVVAAPSAIVRGEQDVVPLRRRA
jgi:diguanylate cyclase (GGDEF)-like protein